MSDLTEFLLARVAEDEGYARTEAVLRDGDPYYSTEAGAFERYFDPARVLAECEAKRRIVTECRQMAGSFEVDHVVTPATISSAARADSILRLLALPYADHPDRGGL